MGFSPLDFAGDLLFGDAPKAKPSGAFPDTKQIGFQFGQIVREDLRQDIPSTPAYQIGANILRDAGATVAMTERQRLGERAQAGGFLDSGVVDTGLTDIGREELATFSRGLANLYLSLQDRRDALALKYLGMASGEHTAIEGINVQAQSARDALIGGMTTDLLTADLGGTALGSIFG